MTMRDEEMDQLSAGEQEIFDDWTDSVNAELAADVDGSWVSALAARSARDVRASLATPDNDCSNDNDVLAPVVLLDPDTNADLAPTSFDWNEFDEDPAGGAGGENVLAFPGSAQPEGNRRRFAFLGAVAAAVLVVVGLAATGASQVLTETPADSVPEVSELPFGDDTGSSRDLEGLPIPGGDDPVDLTDEASGVSGSDDGAVSTDATADDSTNVVDGSDDSESTHSRSDDGTVGPGGGSADGSADDTGQGADGTADEGITDDAPVFDSGDPAPLDLLIRSIVITDPATGVEAVQVTDGATVNLTDLPDRFGIKADAGADVISVRFVVDRRGATDSAAPFVMAPGGGWTPTPGPIQVSVTPFSGPNRSGERAEATVLSFTVVDDRPPASWPAGVTGLTLVDAETDEDVVGLHDGQVLDIAEIGSALNMRADATVDVASVRFDLNDGEHIRIESVLPFAMFGDQQGDYSHYGQWDLVPGEFVISVTPFDEADAGGDAGVTRTITITVVDSGS